MNELIEALQAVQREEGCSIFDHTPEELGIMVMEDHEEILEALQLYTLRGIG